MQKELANSIEEAKSYLRKIQDPGHDIIHAGSTAKSAREIAEYFPEVNADLVETAAWWHDVGRLYDPKTHEAISANMAAESLRKHGLSEKEAQQVYNAIVLHRWDMRPKTIEGEIVRDADKLDFLSVKRWETRIKNQHFKTLAYIAEKLPDLRNKLLHLDVARKIYNKRIDAFLEFIASVDDPGFQEIKKMVLAQDLKQPAEKPVAQQP